MADTNRIIELMLKYVKGTISTDEQAELNAWLNASETNRLRFKERVDEKNILVNLALWDEAVAEKEATRQRIGDRLEAEGVLGEGVGRIVPMRPRFGPRWVAAASVILLLAGGVLFWVMRGSRAAGPEMPGFADAGNVRGNDLPPGGNKAVLTLANGSTIILDNRANGKIATQGTADVAKLDSGKLAYHSAKASAGREQSGKAHSDIGLLYNKVETPRGGQYEVVLQDGSRVWLNAASSIRFPTSFTGSDRKVEITGEAYFEIASVRGRPFHVVVGGMDIEVLGTHFNVNAYTDEAGVKTTLLEGKVKISTGGNSGILHPGEQLQVSGDNSMKLVKDVDMDEVVAWKNGFFQFNGADLPTMMRSIARWYDVQVRYEGTIPKVRASGMISRNTMASDILKVFQTSGFHFRIEGKTIIVMP